MGTCLYLSRSLEYDKFLKDKRFKPLYFTMTIRSNAFQCSGNQSLMEGQNVLIRE